MGDLTKEAIEAGEVELSRVLKDFDYLMPADGMARVLGAALAASPPSPTLPSRDDHIVDANKMVMPSREEIARALCAPFPPDEMIHLGGYMKHWESHIEQADAVLALFTAPQPLAKPMTMAAVEVIERKT